MKHYLFLAGIIIVGTFLRFGNLDSKPLGIDEVLTAIFSLGKTYEDIPKEIIFTFSDLQQLFTLQPEKSCAEIAGTLSAQSTHPPVFFCLMHQWLTWTDPLVQTLVWKLRSLPALLGIGAIVAVYFLNRIAFSPTAGLMGAAAMAVSPFAVYLSQEARHYSLPLLLITLALLGLVQIQKDLDRGKQRPIVWLSWSFVNSLSFYVHYFCLIAFTAQLVTLALLIYKSRVKPRLSSCFFALLPFALLLPWLPILLEHFINPKTGWIPSSESIAPLYQIIIAWLSMVIALPLENQPRSLQVLMGLLTISFGIWLARKSWLGLKLVWQKPNLHGVTLALSCFITSVMLEFFAIVYLLDKDITVAPRYNFVYYPAVCALLGVSIFSQQNKSSQKIERSFIIFLVVGLLSCIFVIFNLAFKKPYLPELVVSNFNRSPAPLMVVVGYQDTIDVALGLSYALALKEVRASERQTFLAFLDRSGGYELVWKKLSEFSVYPLNLWVVAPGLKRIEYPQRLDLGNKNVCQIDPKEHYRVGVPYQLYRCQTVK